VKKPVPPLSQAARLAAAAAVAALVLGACGRREPEPEEAPAPPAEAEPVRELTPDERLAEQVRHGRTSASRSSRVRSS
jgi:hypothetical protein